MLLRSFSNPILKYKPSTILLCFLFCSSFLDYFFFYCFFFLSLPFLLVMSHTSHLQERSPTSIGLLFLQSCLNICLWSLKSESRVLASLRLPENVCKAPAVSLIAACSFRSPASFQHACLSFLRDPVRRPHQVCWAISNKITNKRQQQYYLFWFVNTFHNKSHASALCAQVHLLRRNVCI